MEIECLEVYIMGLMIHNEDGHDFAVAHHARAISMTLSRYVYLVFFELRCKKNLQNSSRIQKISIKFVLVIGVGIFR